MEFNEKLLQLRKERGLTQEELAAHLYVSRTAISKWESGRGYPNIDSLKEISNFFSISIDDLISSEKALYIAKNESIKNIRNICDLLLGIVDLLGVLLIILPLYPKQIEDVIYSVSLSAYFESSSFYSMMYLVMFVLLILIGTIKIVFNQLGVEKGMNIATNVSVVISVATVLLLVMTRQVYAVIIAFLSLIIKGVIIIKQLSVF